MELFANVGLVLLRRNGVFKIQTKRIETMYQNNGSTERTRSRRGSRASTACVPRTSSTHSGMCRAERRGAVRACGRHELPDLGLGVRCSSELDEGTQFGDDEGEGGSDEADSDWGFARIF